VCGIKEAVEERKGNLNPERTYFEALMFEVRHSCTREDNKQQLAGWKGYEIQRRNRVAEYVARCVTR
jgi:hypothetical protein